MKWLDMHLHREPVGLFLRRTSRADFVSANMNLTL